jgi:hypothetical protein
VLEHEDLVVLKDDLGLALHVAARADGDSNVVKKIRTNALCHVNCPQKMFCRGAASAAPFEQPWFRGL